MFNFSKTLVGKLLITYVLFIVCPLSLVSYFSYRSYASSMYVQVAASIARTNEQLTQNVNTYIDELIRLTTLPTSDEKLLSILKRMADFPEETVSYESLADEAYINRFLSQLFINPRRDLLGVLLYSNDKHVYLQSKGGEYVFPPNPNDWYDKLISAQGKWIFVGNETRKISSKENREVFSIIREIHEPFVQKSIGIILVDAQWSKFRDIMRSADAGLGTQYIIVDENSVPIYDPDNKLPSLSLGNLNEEHGQVERLIDNEQTLLTYNKSELTGWTIFSLTSKRNLLKESYHIRMITAGIGIGCVLFSIIIAIVISLRITRPIIKMKSLMERVEKGDFEVMLEIRGRDEVSLLSKTFNKMASQLRESVNRLSQAQYKQKEAELKALQSQINPHFLYNTLESIHMMADARGSNDISEMVTSLGTLLRLNMSGDTFTSIEQEIEMVKSYLYIQKVRYDERIALELDLDPGLFSAAIPRFTLQPIIENAVVHGLEANHLDTLNIHIQVALESSTIIGITIEDNGPGIDGHTLHSLRQHLQLPHSKQFGIGLKNVDERIKLFFGEMYGIRIYSQPDQGTKILIHFPLKKGDYLA